MPTRMMKVTNIHAYVEPRKLDYVTNLIAYHGLCCVIIYRDYRLGPTMLGRLAIGRWIQAMIARDFITKVCCKVYRPAKESRSGECLKFHQDPQYVFQDNVNKHTLELF